MRNKIRSVIQKNTSSVSVTELVETCEGLKTSKKDIGRGQEVDIAKVEE